MIYPSQVSMNQEKVQQLADLLASTAVPPEQESSAHNFSWDRTPDDLANCYLAIVAICHQTSPIGERRLQGKIHGKIRFGWDYLKERFLAVANEDASLAMPEYWENFTPQGLSELYYDEEFGLTLNRVNERVSLVNNLGRRLCDKDLRYVRMAFDISGRAIGGSEGFLQFLSQFEAYSDPLCKKSLFFLSLAITECGWVPSDPGGLLSPIDYHELRGHLRVGTIEVEGPLLRKLRFGLPVTEIEDILLRDIAQKVNDFVAQKAQLTNSLLHYLLWNVFRNCCSRSDGETHCSDCGHSCQLPDRYQQMNIYQRRCMFATICRSAGQAVKLSDPPYIGHYY